MKYSMDKYYTVLHFLRDFFVDREYPVSFNEFNGTYNCDSVNVSTEYISTHKNSYKLAGVSNGDKVTFLIPNRKYDVSDKFEINIASSTSFSPSDIEVSFSESQTGEPIKKEVELDDTEQLAVNKIHNLQYVLKDTATSLDKKAKFMSNLQSITITFNKTLTTVYISDMVFRTDVYQRTLEDIDYHIEDAKNHIIGRISKQEITQVPTELEYLVPKAAAAYSWLMWWENEGRVMSDGTNLARNYFDRLMNDVNGVNYIIDKWIANYEKDNEVDEINTHLVGSVRVGNPHEHFSRNSRRFSKGTYKPRYLRQ